MFRSTVARLLFALAPAVGVEASRIEVTPLIVTAGDPDDDRYRTPLGTGYDGVAALDITAASGRFTCTGSMLATGYVLTAAHCLTDASGSLNVMSVSAVFSRGEDSPPEVIDASGYLVHPKWSGRVERGGDIALIVLANAPSAGVQRYELYEGAGDLGSAYNFAGWGVRGTGDTGATSTTAARRHGANTFDATMAGTFDEFPGWTGGDTVLVSDFDKPVNPPDYPDNSAQDALWLFYDIRHPGLGLDEASGAPGDSGGPAFINGRIAGIYSFRTRLEFLDGETSDVNGVTDSSFGEFNFFTRTSAYNQWIYAVPEPSTAALCALFGSIIAMRSILRRRGPR